MEGLGISPGGSGLGGLAIERDGYRCRALRQGGGQVRGRPHHPTCRIQAGGAPYDLDGLQTLCRPCHLDKTTLDRGGVPHVPDAGWEHGL